MKNRCLFLLVGCFFMSSILWAQTAQQYWDNIKNITMPLVASAFQNDYNTPYRQPLADYGWEDGLHISPDGLHLYTLYSPMDLFSYTSFFSTHLQLPLCDLVGNMDFLRPYAGTYGMDMITNPFGCDSFANIDILYSHRNSVTDSFVSWQLSGIARAGAIEGGPAPLCSQTNSNNLDLFLFSGNGDLWMIYNTATNPAGIGSAVRLPSPINPDSNEFNADNGFLERINGDTVILIYEKYTDASMRTFMYSISNDVGITWNTPQAVYTITNSLGHIEHPCLYRDGNNQWWLYFSIDYSSIVRAQQTEAGNWDSWAAPETIITKGNAGSIGEPTVTQNGDISFVLGYTNLGLNDTADVYDLDPWILTRNYGSTGTENNVNNKLRSIIFPNPITDILSLTFSLPEDEIVSIELVDCLGKKWMVQPCIFANSGVYTIHYNTQELASGIYSCVINAGKYTGTKKFIKK